MDYKETWLVLVMISVTQETDRWLAVVKTLLHLRVS